MFKSEENIKQLIAVQPEYVVKYNHLMHQNDPFILSLMTLLMRKVNEMVRYLIFNTSSCCAITLTDFVFCIEKYVD